MAKKDKKASKKDRGADDPAEVVEAVRERGKGLLEEVTAAAQRIRDSFDDVRLIDDVKALRAEVEALSKRVAALEQTGGSAAPATRRAAARKPAKASVTPSPSKPAQSKADGGAKAAARTRVSKPTPPTKPSSA